MKNQRIRRTRPILLSLLIGFMIGLSTASYLLFGYGYVVDLDRPSQNRVIPHHPLRPAVPSVTNPASWGNPQLQLLAPAPPPEASAESKLDELQLAPLSQQLPVQPAPSLKQPSNQPGRAGIIASQAYPRVAVHPVDPTLQPLLPGTPPKAGILRPKLPESPAGIDTSIADLRKRDLLLPIGNLKKQDLKDSFNEDRPGHKHMAIDILAPRNTPVRAVEDGTIAKLWFSVPGGITIYQFDPQKRYEYYYAHLERYADGLKDGDHVKRGQVIGFVGTSGNAPKNTPHLHFTIFKLTPKKQWWEGDAVNPYQVFK